jgi:hypothetical protein
VKDLQIKHSSNTNPISEQTDKTKFASNIFMAAAPSQVSEPKAQFRTSEARQSNNTTSNQIKRTLVSSSIEPNRNVNSSYNGEGLKLNWNKVDLKN